MKLANYELTNVAMGETFDIASGYFKDEVFSGFEATAEFGSWYNSTDEEWQIRFHSNFLCGTAYFDEDKGMWRILEEDCYLTKY